MELLGGKPCKLADGQIADLVVQHFTVCHNRRKLLFCDFRFNQIRLAFPLDGKRHGVVLAVFQKTDRIVEA